MEATGIVRKMDSLGRLVMPAELRGVMGIKQGDGLEIFVDGELIILQKYELKCVFCGGSDKAATFRDKCICKRCLKAFSHIVDDENAKQDPEP